jgi:predicted ATPase
VLMVFEDAHWIDPTSLELLQVMVDRVQHLPVLLLLTFRPEFQPPWVGQPHTTVLALGRLNRHDTAALVERVASNQGLPPEIVEEIVERTDGVPLFAEELTKAVLETGASERDRKAALSSISPAALTVPTTLHASLMTRLDRLGPTAKEIAQIGAAIGREFRYELIASVARRSKAQVQDGLNHLVGAGLMFQRGTAPQSLYTFKHALVQDAAYGTLLRDRRKELHARIAQVLEQHFLQVAVIQPELLAHHCAEGGLIERAIDYWFAAGERALRTSANVEAVEHLSRGLRLLLSSFPETPDRSRKELRFQTTLGPALATTRGWAAAEVAQAYHRADELARALDNGGELFKIVSGLWLFHIGRGESHRALELSDELFRLAERQNDDDLRLQAHHSAWGSFTFLGDFAASRQHTEQGIALYNPAKHGSHALTYGGHDPGVCGWAQNCLDLWFLGYPDRAAEPVRRSVQLAEEIGHPPLVAHALNYGLLYHQLRRDEAAVSLWSDRLAKLAAEQCLALHEANAIFARGWVQMNQGQARQSVTQLRRALDSCTDLGMREFEPYLKAALAEALVAAGETATGLEVLEDAMLLAQESGVGFWNAELLRLKGESLARLSLDRGHEQVEACYREALAVAQRQQARSLELRAATSLARLWRDQGRHQDARDLLAPVYGWFTEGLDTPDLKEAKTLLADLLGRATPHP